MHRGNDNGFEEWGGYMQAKIDKLEEQFGQSSDYLRQSNLFAGISIYVNGLTNPSADQLKRIMMVNGGVYHHYERSHTTYIVASNLPDVKIRNMNTSNIIRPDWIVDCIKENRILDYTKYLLYTNHKPSQPKLNFKRKQEPLKETEREAEPLREADSSITEEDQECLAILKGLDNVTSVPNAPSPELLPAEEPKPEPEIFKKPNTKIAKSAVDPNFLSEFYNNSRLHHIATLGAGFKQYVSELRENHSGSFPHRDEIRSKLSESGNSKSVPQIIMHIDMDCFFVSVGLRSRPHLRGEPIAVTHSKGGDAAARPGTDRQKERDLYLKRFEEKDHVKTEKIRSGFEGNESLSEIASCSYEARKMGVRNGMFVGQALKLCPGLKTIPYDFEEYKEVAFTLYNTVAQYTLNIEAVSCDEMFVDLSEALKDLQAAPLEFVSYLRDEVKTKTGCPCSAGLGGNRLQARMATKKAKPDGQFYLSPENVEEYMSSIPFSDLPGVGHSTSYTLEQLNLKTCGDLQLLSLAKLQQELGKKFGETLYQFCRGIDNRPLVYGQIRKSISAEVNYGIRFTEYEELEKFLQQLCVEVHSRLMGIKRRGKCITLKLMVRAKEAPIETSKYMGHGYCDNLTKSTTLQEYTCDLAVITKTILNTMKSLNLPPKELRGIGIHIAKLDNPDGDGKAKKGNVLKTMFSKVVEKQKETLKTTEPAESVIENPIELSDYAEVKPKEPNKKASKTPVTTIPEKRKMSPTAPDQDKKPSKVQKKTRGKAKIVKTMDVSNMLQNAAVAKRKTPEPLPPNIDYAVLAELPEDIREEVLREHRQLAKMKTLAQEPKVTTTITATKTSSTTVDTDFLLALPPELRMEVERDVKRQLELNATDSKPTKQKNSENVKDDNVVQSDNIFDHRNCRQLIELWVESSDRPEDCDVDLFAQNAQELVQAKRITELFVPLRLLHRIIGMKSNCDWHASYRSILNVVQREMVATYGSRMMVEDEIRCENC